MPVYAPDFDELLDFDDPRYDFDGNYVLQPTGGPAPRNRMPLTTEGYDRRVDGRERWR